MGSEVTPAFHLIRQARNSRVLSQLQGLGRWRGDSSLSVLVRYFFSSERPFPSSSMSGSSLSDRQMPSPPERDWSGPSLSSPSLLAWHTSGLQDVWGTAGWGRGGKGVSLRGSGDLLSSNLNIKRQGESRVALGEDWQRPWTNLGPRPPSKIAHTPGQAALQQSLEAGHHPGGVG